MRGLLSSVSSGLEVGTGPGTATGTATGAPPSSEVGAVTRAIVVGTDIFFGWSGYGT